MNGLLQAVSGFFCFGEKPDLLTFRAALHRKYGSIFFQEWETEEEKGLEIGEGS
jgi:hypothetical protein